MQGDLALKTEDLLFILELHLDLFKYAGRDFFAGLFQLSEGPLVLQVASFLVFEVDPLDIVPSLNLVAHQIKLVQLVS